MQGVSSPAGSSSRMAVSPGHGRWALLVIIARMVCPPSLNKVLLSTRAGRRFVFALSVNGKGTIITSHGSEITEGLLIFRGGPFVECIGEGCMKSSVKRF